MARLHTTLGPKRRDELGLILPHEHIFVDLGPIETKSYLKAQAHDVVTLMQPEVEKAKALGVSALVECTPVGVGRRVDMVKAVSEAARFPIVVATGIYQEPWIPHWAHQATAAELRGWMVRELHDGIDSTGVKAAFIKLSASNDGMTACEEKILRAAAGAAALTGAVIGSHTLKGRTVLEQLDVLEEAGHSPGRFIWIHTQAEADVGLHDAVAERGTWLEFDAIGSEAYRDDYFIERLTTLCEAGYGRQLLVSHDRGWYDPSKPGGGKPKPFTYLSRQFLPKLGQAGFDRDTLDQLTRHNPFNAFAR